MAKFRTGDIPQFKDVNDVASYLYQMQEQIGYVLNHLEEDNFADYTYGDLTAKQPKSGNLTEISQYGLTKPGKRYGAIPYVQADGGMEVGNYLDFHTSSGDTSDFVQRISGGADGVVIGSTPTGASTGTIGSVSRTAGSMGRNSTIIGQCFCTCLGNGRFRFDVAGKWTVGSGVTTHDYGISKDFLRRGAYNNIYGNTGSLANLNFVTDGECLIFSASDYTFGHPNVDYGWSVQSQTYSYCLARLYNTSGANGGWEGNVVSSTFPSGFHFKATIWASLA